MEKLQKAVDESIEKAHEAISNANNAINKTAERVEEKANKALEGVEKSFEKSLDDIKAMAAKSGVNIDECLGEDEKRLVSLPGLAANQTVLCTESLILQATKYVDNELDKVSFKFSFVIFDRSSTVHVRSGTVLNSIKII